MIDNPQLKKLTRFTFSIFQQSTGIRSGFLLNSIFYSTIRNGNKLHVMEHNDSCFLLLYKYPVQISCRVKSGKQIEIIVMQNYPFYNEHI